MNSSRFKHLLLPIIMGGSFILLDVVADRLSGGPPDLDLPHLILAALILLTTAVVLRSTEITRRHADALSRRAHDELENRVRERTAELERANAALQQEMGERQRAEARIQHLSSFPQLNPNPVLEVDASGNITFCNAAAAKMLEGWGLAVDGRAFLPGDLATILQELEQKKEARFQREVQVGSAIFEETVHVIPTFKAARVYAYDITGRKHAEEALREANEHLQEQAEELEVQTEELADANEQLRQSEQRFRLALKNAPLTVATQDRNLRFLWAYNQHTVDPAAVIGKTDADLFPPGDAARLVALKRQVLETGVEVKDQFWLTSGGQRVFLEVYLEPIRDAAGQIAGIGIATVNLTERKLVEEALRESEQKYSAIFDKSPFALALTRVPEGAIVSVNDAFLKLFEYTREEVIGKTSVDLGIADPDSRAQVAAELQARGSVHDFEATRTTKSGAQRVLSLNLDWVSVGGVNHVLTTIHDIAERKRAEEVVQRSEAMLRTVLDQMPSGVTVRDARTGELILSNARSRAIMGALVDTAGQFSQYRGLHPDGRPYATEDWPVSRSMATGEVVDAEEIECERSDGARITLSINSAPVRDSRGQITIGVGVFHDVTERKRAEAEIQRAAEELRAANEELTRFNNVMVGRELRMIELKKEVNALCERAGQPRRYSLDFEKEGM